MIQKSGKMGFRGFLPYFILATVSLLFGAVEAWVWSFYVFLILAAFVVALWRGELPHWRPGVFFMFTVGGWVGAVPLLAGFFYLMSKEWEPNLTIFFRPFLNTWGSSDAFLDAL